MKFWSESFKDGARIPEDYAFGKIDVHTHISLSSNKNPHLAWSDLPAGAKSLVLICVDPDAPSVADDVNQEGKTVLSSLKRADFYHWVLVDISPESAAIQEGEFSQEVMPRGKSGPSAPRGTRQGINNYTDWFKGDQEMEGTYFGYDGPCPPWNDELVHRYVFTLYATNLERCGVETEFNAHDVLKSIEDHILEKSSLTGLYSLNPNKN